MYHFCKWNDACLKLTKHQLLNCHSEDGFEVVFFPINMTLWDTWIQPTSLRHHDGCWCRGVMDMHITIQPIHKRHQMKTFPRYWLFERGIHRSPVDSPFKGQWRGALMFSLICAWKNGWANNRDASDFRSHRAHYDVTVLVFAVVKSTPRRFLWYWRIPYLIVIICLYYGDFGDRYERKHHQSRYETPIISRGRIGQVTSLGHLEN